MGQVEQVLVVGVGVHGRHKPGVDAERVVEYLHHRHEAVGRARGVAHHVVQVAVVGGLVDAHDERRVDVARRCRDDHLARTSSQVHGGGLTAGEMSRRLDNDVNAELLPGQVLGVALCEHLDARVADGHLVLADAHGHVEAPLGRVVLQEVRVGLG